MGKTSYILLYYANSLRRMPSLVCPARHLPARREIRASYPCTFECSFNYAGRASDRLEQTRRNQLKAAPRLSPPDPESGLVFFSSLKRDSIADCCNLVMELHLGALDDGARVRAGSGWAAASFQFRIAALHSSPRIVLDPCLKT